MKAMKTLMVTTLVLVLALWLAVMVAVADEDTVSGSFTADNSVPDVIAAPPYVQDVRQTHPSSARVATACGPCRFLPLSILAGNKARESNRRMLWSATGRLLMYRASLTNTAHMTVRLRRSDPM